MDFLKVKNSQIVNSKGEKVFLRGIALGGWLMMEGYILGGRNIPESDFKQTLKDQLGPAALAEFTWRFRENFFNESDVLKIKKLGANVVRIPFNYRLLEKAPYVSDKKGLALLVKAVSWFKKKNIYVILDLHAAPGGQNPDWHSDCSARPAAPGPLLWKDKNCQKRTYALWEKIAQTFKDEPAVAGYDILNEPVTENWPLLNEFYAQITKTIRSVDPRHIIFYEGNHYARDFSGFKKPAADNIALSLHFYEPLEFVFRWVAAARYPGKIKNVRWNKKKLKKILGEYKNLSEKLKMPVYLGEFGVASRCPEGAEELLWVKDMLDICKKLGWHWTYWTYKSVAGAFYPDGLYQYLDYDATFQIYWIPAGIEKFPQLLQKNKEHLYQALRTESFTLNQKLAAILKK